MSSDCLPRPSQVPHPGGRTLIAGVGNVLLGDDGFGVEVIRRLQSCGDLPAGVWLIETGIGGISLVQELLSGYGLLVVVDAVQQQRPAGSCSLQEMSVPELRSLPQRERTALLADTHYANPARALSLAGALDALPARVYLLGCQADPRRDFGPGLSPAVQAAVGRAAGWLRAWLVQSSQEEE